MKEQELKKIVREGYAKIAKTGSPCCGPVSCCSDESDVDSRTSSKIGYTDEELQSVPEGADLGLGCGNPTALASLREGETVLDLGAGGGFDCFLAANKVGKKGKVIGVDMTPEMLDKARQNARKGKYENVEFRLGEIENLPVADGSVDVIISNCVINLSPDKKKVFQEAFRVLKPGGKLMVSDIVLMQELPAFIQESLEAYVACVSGAMLKDRYVGTIRDAGFHNIKILDEKSFPAESAVNDPTLRRIIEGLNMPIDKVEQMLRSVVSIAVTAEKRRA